MTKQTVIDVENLTSARFECVFPTCGGICCKQGRPPIEPGERARIEKHLAKFLPLVRPAARVVIERKGFVTRRIKEGRPMLAVSEGWCVFENGGCVLQKVGMQEGEPFKYKPWHCVVFPLERHGKGEWFVRQWTLHGEGWDLFCLNPKESPKRADETCASEVEFAERFDSGEERWRGGTAAE